MSFILLNSEAFSFQILLQTVWGTQSLLHLRTLHQSRALASHVAEKAGLCFSEERRCLSRIIYLTDKINVHVCDLNINFPLRFIIHCVFEGIFNNFSS